MRIKKGFVLHHVCEQDIIVAEGRENIDFNNIISLNESAAAIWRKLADKEFTIDDMAGVLCAEYDVRREEALRDSTALAQQWISSGIAEE